MKPLPKYLFFAIHCFICWASGALVPNVPAADGESPLHQRIDSLIGKRISELKITSAAVSDDSEFVRRVYLDLNGVIPSVYQARKFLDDTANDKREKLIDELLANPQYALNMARAFDVMLTERRIPTTSSYDVPLRKWREYLTGAFAENRPWDQMVREILGSDGTAEKYAAGVKFYLVRDVSPHQLTRDVGRLFLGIDLQCAQCHDDPRIDDYRQSDYFGIYAFLQRVTPFRDAQKNVSLVGETATGKTTFTSVFTAKRGETNPKLPGGDMIADPEVEKSKEYIVKPGPKERGVPTYSRRQRLAEVLPRGETQGFTRNIANRLWSHMMGRGIVHPLDLHHSSNPPSHPELLIILEQWLVKNDYDIKAFLREVALSQTYQRSSVSPKGATDVPDDSFAVAKLRGLTAEQLRWSVLQATGRIEEHFAALDKQPKKTNAGKSTSDQSTEGEPAWKLEFARLEPLERSTQTLIGAFTGVPGNPEGEFQPIVDQALYLLNSPQFAGLLDDPAPCRLIARLIAVDDVNALTSELYLPLFSRHPTNDERAEVRSMLEPAKTPAERRELLRALVRGLLFSAEFRLNH